MALALNKTTLKRQSDQAKLYRKFLPSLELKRQQLQATWQVAREELANIERDLRKVSDDLEPLYALVGSDTINIEKLSDLIQIQTLNIVEENVVGVRLPKLASLELHVGEYSHFTTPFWVDSLIDSLRRVVEIRVRIDVARQRTERLEFATRRITQRVNLFDRVLIPRAEENIRRIVIFLSDQDRAAVVRSKIAKARQVD